MSKFRLLLLACVLALVAAASSTSAAQSCAGATDCEPIEQE